MSSILQVLNRGPQKKQQDERRETEEKKRGPWITRHAKWFMFVFFNAVALVFDGLAVTTVYKLTNGNLLLSALSLLPTGVPMFMWEAGWLYPLADKAQKIKSLWGIGISILSALVVGSLAIVATLTTDPQETFLVSASLLIWCVIIVITHGILAALYFYRDPVIIRDHELQVTKADNDYQRETLRDAEALLGDAERMLERERIMRERFGEKEVNRALEILMGIDLDGDGKIGDKPIKQQQPQTRPAFAQEAKQPILDEPKDFTNRPPQK